MDRFHRRIDRTDAENYTVREFLKDLPTGIWWVTNLYPILPMQKVDVLSCFSNSKLRLVGAPFPASFSTGFFLTTRMTEVSKLLHFHPAEMWLLDFNFLNFIYLSGNLFVVKIFLETLLRSSAQVNCVPDKILLDKSPCLIFFVWFLLDMEVLYEVYIRESCQCKCSYGDSVSKF